MRKRWRQRNGKLIPYDELPELQPAGPYVMGDIKPYTSVITGETITSRSHHRQHLRDHGAIEVGSEKPQWLKEKYERRNGRD